MRDDQTAGPVILQEMFQENLRSQVEEVGRFVEQQEIRFMQQERSQLQARLPAAGELRDRSLQVAPLQFELPGDFSTFPFGLFAVPHQKLESGLLRKERIMLSQIPQSQTGMTNDFSAIEFFLAEQNPEQGTFPGPVAADEPHLDIVADRGLGFVE